MRDEVFWDREVETLPRSKLEALQLERLRWQVTRCYDHSPFYREKFERAGVAPRHLDRLQDIRHFPFVTKQELRQEQAAHPPFGRYVLAPPESWRELHPSSGTTGHPVHTIWSHRDVEVITEHTARTMWSFGTRPTDVVQNAFSYGLWVAGMAVHYATARLGAFCLPTGTSPASHQIELMVRARSTVLLATPSFGLYLGERLREAGCDPETLALRIGCFGGEAGTELPSTRARLERSLGIDAFDYYGLAEIGPTFASECTEKAGLHWAEDHFLVVTHLTREATPMIRYWTNDYARLDPERCRCGRTHARSPGGIVGRSDDLIVSPARRFNRPRWSRPSDGSRSSGMSSGSSSTPTRRRVGTGARWWSRPWPRPPRTSGSACAPPCAKPSWSPRRSRWSRRGPWSAPPSRPGA